MEGGNDGDGSQTKPKTNHFIDAKLTDSRGRPRRTNQLRRQSIQSLQADVRGHGGRVTRITHPVLQYQKESRFRVYYLVPGCCQTA